MNGIWKIRLITLHETKQGINNVALILYDSYINTSFKDTKLSPVQTIIGRIVNKILPTTAIILLNTIIKIDYISKLKQS